MVQPAILVNGAVGGLIASMISFGFMYAVMKDKVLPTADILVKYGDNDSGEEDLNKALAIFLAYGSIIGLLFSIIQTSISSYIRNLQVSYSLIIFLILGAVMVAGYGIRNLSLDIEIQKEKLTKFLASHLVYAAVLGTWFGIGATVL